MHAIYSTPITRGTAFEIAAAEAARAAAIAAYANDRFSRDFLSKNMESVERDIAKTNQPFQVFFRDKLLTAAASAAFWRNLKKLDYSAAIDVWRHEFEGREFRGISLVAKREIDAMFGL